MVVHFPEQGSDFFPQVGGEFHLRALSRLAVIQKSSWNVATKHLFEAHGLRGQLEDVDVVGLRFPFFVLDGCGEECARSPVNRDALGTRAQFHDVALSADSQLSRMDGHSSGSQEVASFFGEESVVCVFVQNIPFDRTNIVCPQSFDVNQRPLPSAEREVLDAGKLEVVFFGIFSHGLELG